ncbi:MAG: putative diguanylate cyclase [Naasia sp.]|nr:putative diguanylate cyclase [Naasia sp.]
MNLSLFAPALDAWHRHLRAYWDTIPRPRDAPGSYAAGTSPDRVLIVGTGPAAGWGVLSHDLALPGQLARRLSERTGHGADVDLVATPFMTIGNVARELADTRLWRYDAVVVVLGVPDVLSLTPVRDWEERLEALLRLLNSSCSASTHIVVTGIQPLRSVRPLDTPIGALLDRRGRRYDCVTAALVRGRPRVSFVPLELGPDSAEGSSSLYAEWGERIAEALEVPMRSGKDHVHRPADALRHGADDEAERQGELDRMRVTQEPGGPAVHRIAALAREAFGTRYAAVTLIDGERQVFKASVGRDAEDMPRVDSFCTHTIQREGTMVVPDALVDPRFEGSAMVQGDPHIRFYAGYPLESPGGYRIGALCVFDPDPRADAEIDVALLHSLAKLAERELALEARRTARDAEPALSAPPRAARAR